MLSSLFYLVDGSIALYGRATDMGKAGQVSGGTGRSTESSRVKREREQDRTSMSVFVARLSKSRLPACSYDRRPGMLCCAVYSVRHASQSIRYSPSLV